MYFECHLRESESEIALIWSREDEERGDEKINIEIAKKYEIKQSRVRKGFECTL